MHGMNWYNELIFVKYQRRTSVQLKLKSLFLDFDVHTCYFPEWKSIISTKLTFSFYLNHYFNCALSSNRNNSAVQLEQLSSSVQPSVES